MEDTAWKMEAREVWPWAAGPMTDGGPALTKNEIFLLIQCTDHITCHRVSVKVHGVSRPGIVPTEYPSETGKGRTFSRRLGPRVGNGDGSYVP